MPNRLLKAQLPAHACQRCSTIVINDLVEIGSRRPESDEVQRGERGEGGKRGLPEDLVICLVQMTEGSLCDSLVCLPVRAGQ